MVSACHHPVPVKSNCSRNHCVLFCLFLPPVSQPANCVVVVVVAVVVVVVVVVPFRSDGEFGRLAWNACVHHRVYVDIHECCGGRVVGWLVG